MKSAKLDVSPTRVRQIDCHDSIPPHGRLRDGCRPAEQHPAMIGVVVGQVRRGVGATRRRLADLSRPRHEGHLSPVRQMVGEDRVVDSEAVEHADHFA